MFGPRRRLLRLFSLYALLGTISLIQPWASPTAFADSTSAMQFTGRPPTDPVIIFGNSWYIYARGFIDDGASARLSNFLDTHKVPPRSIIAFDSPGGNVLAALKLGRVIRDAGLYSYVGSAAPGPDDLMAPGECYSACTLAFLGGEYRWFERGSKYGVHRFYSLIPSDRDSDTAQLLSAAIVQYIRDMGVSPELFDYMSLTDKSDITVLPEDRLKLLGVVNDGEGPTSWTVEGNSGVLYVKGERETFRGVNKFIISCTPKTDSVYLFVIFDPEGHGDEIVEMNATSLFVDEKIIHMDGRAMEKPKLQNGWVNAAFRLDPSMLNSILGAKNVGVAFQPTYEAPTFWGFQGMDLSGGREKLRAYLRTCS